MGIAQNGFCRCVLIVAIAIGITGCSDRDTLDAPKLPDAPSSLARVEYRLGIGIAISQIEFVELELSYSENSEHVSLGVLTLRDGDDGTVVKFGSGSSESYGEFISMLNNGQDDLLRVEARYGEGRGGVHSSDHLESQRLVERSSDSIHPDMVETPVTRVEAWIEKASIEVPGRDPNSDGEWADVHIRVAFLLY